MTIGSALILVAVGAILRYAVADSWDAVDLSTVGLILMGVGAVGFVIGLIQFAELNRSRKTEVVHETTKPER